MFPYVYIDPDWIGGIEPFGVLVAIGVLFGAEMARRHALRTGLNLEELRRMAFYALVVGFVSAHLVDLFLYQPGWFEEDPWRIFKLWAGISSYGGFIGGAAGVAFYIFVRSGKNKLPPDEPGRLAHAHPVAYADAFAYGAVGGWTFGRLACAVVHDHVGKASDFLLAVDFPPGNASGIPPGSAHDLGLYEFLWITAMFIGFTLWLRKPRREGMMLGLFAMLYSVPRFFFEFLRFAETDPRYAGLTPAQWFSLGAFVAGALFVRRALRGPAAPDDYKQYDVYLESADAEQED